MIISAYSVTTEPRGFATCFWPATSRAGAESLAKDLSEKKGNDPIYPNAFWVTDGEKSLCKFFRGERYDARTLI